MQTMIAKYNVYVFNTYFFVLFQILRLEVLTSVIVFVYIYNSSKLTFEIWLKHLRNYWNLIIGRVRIKLFLKVVKHIKLCL